MPRKRATAAEKAAAAKAMNGEFDEEACRQRAYEISLSEQAGTLRVVKNDVLLPAPALTVTVDATNERGLLGTAFLAPQAVRGKGRAFGL